jgi:hypothetical protein
MREAKNWKLEIFANVTYESIVERFLLENKLGITSWEQTDDWSWRKLFKETYVYWGEMMAEYLRFRNGWSMG